MWIRADRLIGSVLLGAFFFTVSCVSLAPPTGGRPWVGIDYVGSTFMILWMIMTLVAGLYLVGMPTPRKEDKNSLDLRKD